MRNRLPPIFLGDSIWMIDLPVNGTMVDYRDYYQDDGTVRFYLPQGVFGDNMKIMYWDGEKWNTLPEFYMPTDSADELGYVEVKAQGQGTYVLVDFPDPYQFQFPDNDDKDEGLVAWDQPITDE